MAVILSGCGPGLFREQPRRHPLRGASPRRTPPTPSLAGPCPRAAPARRAGWRA